MTRTLAEDRSSDRTLMPRGGVELASGCPMGLDAITLEYVLKRSATLRKLLSELSQPLDQSGSVGDSRVPIDRFAASRVPRLLILLLAAAIHPAAPAQAVGTP